MWFRWAFTYVVLLLIFYSDRLNVNTYGFIWIWIFCFHNSAYLHVFNLHWENKVLIVKMKEYKKRSKMIQSERISKRSENHLPYFRWHMTKPLQPGRSGSFENRSRFVNKIVLCLKLITKYWFPNFKHWVFRFGFWDTILYSWRTPVC